MFLNKKKNFTLNELQTVLKNDNLTLFDKQHVIESWDIPINEDTNKLLYVYFLEEKSIIQSKKKLRSSAKKILETTRIPDELHFITDAFLTAITLALIVKLFSRLEGSKNSISHQKICQLISDHFIYQIAWERVKPITEKKKLKECDLVNKIHDEINQIKKENILKKTLVLSAKIVDHLESAGVTTTQIETVKKFNKPHTVKELVLSQTWFAIAMSERKQNNILPMVSNPIDWQCKTIEGETRLVGGGFIKNFRNHNITALLYSASKIFKAKHSQISCANFNYLQSIPFKIDKQMINYMQHNPFSIKEYLQHKSEIANKTREQFAGYRQTYNKEKAQIFDIATIVCNDILYSLDFMAVLKDTEIYFITTSDGRGRIYQSGFPLSPLAQNYIRSAIITTNKYKFSKILTRENWEHFKKILISRYYDLYTRSNFFDYKEKDLDEIKTLFETDSIIKIDNFESNPIHGNYEKHSLSVKDWSTYKSLSLYNKIKKTEDAVYTDLLLGLDVTASGLQIMSLITSSILGLKLTKVFSDKRLKKKDIYEVIHQEVVKDYPIIEKFVRKEYKAIIMKLAYGESTYSRAKGIAEYFQSLSLTQDTTYEEKKKKNFSERAAKSKLPRPSEIAAGYSAAIFKVFPEYKKFETNIRAVLNFRMKFNLPFHLNISDIYSATQYYNLDKSVVISYRGKDNRPKKFSIKLPELGNPEDRFQAKQDVSKTRRATLPNLIHHIDSLILHKVVEQFRIRKKIIFTVHDAFYITLNDIKFLKNTYYQALKEIYELNPYEKILNNNKISSNEVNTSLMTVKQIKQIDAFNKKIDKMVINLPERIKFTKMNGDILV